MARKILLVYTGGTIGMKQDPETLALKPFNFNQILEEVPELKKFGCEIDTYSFDPVIDSSDVQPQFWITLAEFIRKNYSSYDGFVILHGTDTMSYTASALSFMFENLSKPVVLTGSQLPIGMLRTDGKENLISSIEIASATDVQGHPMVPEVCIYFDTHLYRGNRTTKYNAENFRAFRSANSPVLADVGIHIKYNTSYIRTPDNYTNFLKVSKNLDTRVAVLKIFPGITPQVMDAVLGMEGLRGVVLETFGSGNAPTAEWFVSRIKDAVRRGILVLNVTQCLAGKVDMDAYATGIALKNEGVISGYDSTTEAALTKMFYVLGQSDDLSIIKELLNSNLRGEISN
ncbi:MAG: type I asparaginase [Bacteroidales bacterium]|nr:type I asparaginase [Bacteroidales bacterium]